MVIFISFSNYVSILGVCVLRRKLCLPAIKVFKEKGITAPKFNCLQYLQVKV